MSRKGLGLGTGSGYKNMIAKDPSVHSQSSKGIKQPQRIPANVLSYINKNPDAIRKVLEEKHNIKSEKIYSFNDLPKDVQQKALDNLRDINVDHDWWDDEGLLELTENEIKEANIKALSKDWYNKPLDANGQPIGEEYPAYSGLFKWKDINFDLDRRDYLQFNELKVTNDDVFRKFLGIPKKLWEELDYDFENQRENYTQLIFSPKDYSDKPLTQKEQTILEGAGEKFNWKMHQAKNSLKKTYEYYLSDKAVKETIDANEYKFNLSGKIA